MGPESIPRVTLEARFNFSETWHLQSNVPASKDPVEAGVKSPFLNQAMFKALSLHGHFYV